MSGICGMVTSAGEGIDPPSFAAWAERLRERGPDGLGTHVEAQAALALGLLRTGPGPAHAGPTTLDGRHWIVADARIDDRARLLERLRSRGESASRASTDAELILHAYRAWGGDCATRLLGDFAFAIWDSRERSLFCARDHFGVKPFFHAWDGKQFRFSNDLHVLLAETGRDPDELAIADFLLFEMNRDPASTAYRAIRRLPPAHALRVGMSGPSIAPYWELPREPRLEFRANARDYVEGFRAALRSAVEDRSRSDRICVHMSGGLDSPAVARAAVDCSPGARIVAHTAVYRRLFEDDEEGFARSAASALGIPVTFHPGDDYQLFERHAELSRYVTELCHRPVAAFEIDLARRAAEHGRVALTGWDGDTLLSESPRPYFRYLFGRGRVARLLREGGAHALAERKIVPTGTWGRMLGRRPKPRTVSFPAWLDEDFARRLGLRERASELGDVMPQRAHPVRPYAMRILEYVMQRSNFFDHYDPGFTGSAVEFRHPMFDLRLVEYCLSLPPYPWCVRKHILRESMRDALPLEVLARPKTPLAGFPFMEILKDPRSRWIDEFAPSPATTAYVNRAKIPLTRSDPDPEAAWLNLRPVALDLWIRDARSTGLHP